MCGISGIYFINKKPVKQDILKRMNDSQRHRGPDDEGIYISKNIGLAHRRLSIIDISERARQPISNEDSTIWIVHNGEIYNYLELRSELISHGHTFKTHTDSEVILHAYEQWGKECLDRFNGMWSFCIWDERKKQHFVSRDRFGIKPLYYYSNASVFIFASEIKALLATGSVPREPSYPAIYDYLVHGQFGNTEQTFFEGIQQLAPAHYMEIDTISGKINLQCYWQLDIDKETTIIKDEDYRERFLELFKDSVRLRMRSDVPVGAFLSGGLDSSSIVCVMDKLRHASKDTSSNLHTITNIYESKAFDETKFVHSIVNKADIDVYYAYPKGSEMKKDLDSIMRAQEEPVGCARVYSQWEQYKKAKECGLKVVLDGQGGDEILGGYTFFYGYYYAQLLKKMRLFRFIKELSVFPKNGQGSMNALLVDIFKKALPQSLRMLVWKTLISNEKMRNGVDEGFASKFKKVSNFSKAPAVRNKNLFKDIIYKNIPLFLQQAFKITDRTASYFAIENRTPFMDYRLATFALQTPDQQKIRNGVRKHLLREAMKEILPEDVRTRRDKMQFPSEQDQWFRKNLSGYFNDILHSESFKKRPFFNHKEIENEYENFSLKEGHTSNRLWLYMNLEIWMRMYIDNGAKNDS